MAKLIAFIWLLAGGCSLGAVNASTLGLSTASLACDWGQTHKAANNWASGITENNWVMGENPSTAAISTYFAAIMAANAGLWWAMPKKWRWVMPTAITIIQAWSIWDNWTNVTAVDLGWCGR